MDISTDEIHPHCLQCIRLLKCAASSQPGESCKIINCPLDCGASFHGCKLKEHRLLCMNERVPCINAEYGCPALMFRKHQSKHLISCPASIIHCSEEWDRWPIHFHEKKIHNKNNNIDPILQSHLDVALAMRDQRMLRKWCMAAAQGQSLGDQKFTISPSSSLWIFRKWHSSREYSYPPGLEQSVCNELCKSCNSVHHSSNSGSMPHFQSTITRTGTVLDSFCLNYNSLLEKENSSSTNNKQEKPETIIPKEKIDDPVKNKPKEKSTNDMPQYNLDDVLQLSQFGTIIYHQSSGEGSIRVAIDNLPANSDNHNIACQILDFKFKNPSSTPPWCLPLGLDLNLESRSPHPPSYFMYTFLCCQEFRRDEYGWHYKNAHSEIHGGLNGWLIERCPLAQYGCKFARLRFSPAPENSSIVYNDVLESFGVAYKVPSCKIFKSDMNSSNETIYQNGYHGLNLVDLPFDVLQHIVRYLDSFSLANLSLTSVLLRDVCSSVLKDRGLVHYKWEKHKKDDKCIWKRSKYKKRVKPGSVENFMSMLKWTNLIPDESPEIGGPFAPYTQSERLEIYKEKANILLESGAAYRCFCSETRLNLLRKESQLKNLNRGYDNKCRNLTSSEEKKLLSEDIPYTIRFKIPQGQVIHKDMVYGESTYNLAENEGDFIILKSDGFPTYHFSCVVDDHLMEISHVLRGTEWLISTPKHILLHQSFGWMHPKFAHLPLLVNSDRTKLSKRQESIGVEYFKNKGYFPESLLNFLAAAGGGFGKQEGCFVYDLDVLCSKFQLENMNTGSCIVDLRKLDLFNHNYIVKQLSKEETASEMIKKVRNILKEKYGYRYENEKKNLPDSYILKTLLVYKDRLNNLNEFVEGDMEFLWTAPDLNDILKKIEDLKLPDSVVNGWRSVVSLITLLPDAECTKENLAIKLKDLCTKENIPHVSFMRSLRILLTGQKDGPGVAEILVMLGKQRSVNKMNAILDGMNKEKVSNHM